MENRILVLSGPTGVGKTALSIKLAKILNTEIISGDSMQIYKGMDIGTAKITDEEADGIKHHLVDILEPDENYSVAEFKEYAKNIIGKMHENNMIPMIVGGTGLFIDSIIKNLNFTQSIKDDDFRNRMEDLAKEKGFDFVHNMLFEVDPISAEKIHKNNIKRVIRALEVFNTTGTRLSSYKDPEGLNPEYKVFYYYLNMDREKLYDRINLRVDEMITKGLKTEVENLLNSGLDIKNQSMQGIGYKEMISYIHGEISFETAIDKIKQASRNYAKRQLTWFRNDKFAVELNKDSMGDEEIIDKILADLNEK